MGKARVNALKVMTIPRLELSAAVLSLKVSKLLRNELRYPSFKEVFWVDSKVILGYINNDIKRFHIIVANRLQQIREASSPHQWTYISTDKNPADAASRGLTPSELLNSNLIPGPDFLWNVDISYDEQQQLSSGGPEVRKSTALATKTSITETNHTLSRLSRFSDWTKAKQAIEACFKFLHSV